MQKNGVNKWKHVSFLLNAGCFNRDPYFMAYYNPHINWVGFRLLYALKNRLGHMNSR